MLRHLLPVSFAALAAFWMTACNRSPSSAQASAKPPDVSSNIGSTQPRSSGPLSYADVVDRVSPSVVTIRSSRRVRAPEQFPFGDDPFFRRFFGGRRRDNDRSSPSEVEQALGSGVIVSTDGHILTNHHVISGAEEIKVDLKDRRTFPATVIGSDAPSDLAVLKVSAGDLPAMALADSDHVRVGDICLALGNPLGIGQTVTAGIVSAKGRSTGLSNGSFEDFIQTDAPINQGNSGGALVNTTSELIGINSQIVSTTGGNIGIGFAVPSNMAKSVMSQLESQGKVRRGQLGVSIQPVTSDLATKFGLKEVRGVLVNSVAPGGPADKAGIRAGDIVTAVNGTPIDDPNSFRNQVASTPPGTSVTLSILRDGKQQQVTVRLGELKADSVTPDQRSDR